MESTTDDRLAAQITLLALRASLGHPGDVTVAAVIVLPNLAPLPESLALEKLAEGQKPVVCAAFSVLGCLAVASWPVAGASPGQFDVQDEIEWIERELGMDNGGLVAIRTEGSEMSVPIPLVMKWLAEYRLPFIDRSITPNRTSDSGDGIVAVITFGAPAGGVRITIN